MTKHTRGWEGVGKVRHWLHLQPKWHEVCGPGLPRPAPHGGAAPVIFRRRGATPGRASWALQPLDKQSRSKTAAGWHRFCPPGVQTARRTGRWPGSPRAATRATATAVAHTFAHHPQGGVSHDHTSPIPPGRPGAVCLCGDGAHCDGVCHRRARLIGQAGPGERSKPAGGLSRRRSVEDPVSTIPRDRVSSE